MQLHKVESNWIIKWQDVLVFMLSLDLYSLWYTHIHSSDNTVRALLCKKQEKIADYLFSEPLCVVNIRSPIIKQFYDIGKKIDMVQNRSYFCTKKLKKEYENPNLVFF